jgi:Zn-dependent protease with chaperone function
MDFFEAQDRAKKRTTRLVVLFALAVLGTIASSYLVAILLIGQVSPRSRQLQSDYWKYQRTATWDGGGALTRWWDPQIFAMITGGILLVAGGASLFKWLSFRAGGSAVAESVGARRIEPGRATPDERRLLNVVEEMAIASGVPIPTVYVLDDEPALNAFAAGLTTGDAVIAVTRGTLEKLSRDELQGVVAHEFSHILNGDMRLNVKLSAIIFGILVIGLMGRVILFSLGRGRVRVGGGGKNKGGGIAVILAVGLALLLIGYIGYFFGRLIQAAVSRQREFLADASAVQFTRNPAGITGALKKIGGYALGSKVISPKAAELGHFFFAQGFRSHFGGLWATHPPLEERIRAIDPQWDGKVFAPETVVDITRENFQTAGFAGPRLSPDEAARRAYAAPAGVVPPVLPVRIPFQPAAVMADIGAITATHFNRAQSLLDALPAGLRDASTDPVRAQAIIYGLLLGATEGNRAGVRELVSRHAGEEAAGVLDQLRPALSLLDPAARLPLLLLCTPVLRTLDAPALDCFTTTLDELVHADGQVTTFEFVLQKVLTHHLALARKPTQSVQFDSFNAVTGDISVALSALARTGGAAEPVVVAAFLAGAAQLPLIAHSLNLRPVAQTGFEELDLALDRLAVSSLPIKRRLLTAATHVIGSDGTVTVEEGELFRAIALAIDCPAPLLNAA